MQKLLQLYFITLLLLISLNGKGQTTEDGLLKVKKEITYWDLDSTKIRSVGFYNTTGFSHIGERVGKWSFFDKNGKIEEVTYYWEGFKHGPSTIYYPNSNKEIEAYFYLGVLDSIFKAYYEDGTLAEEGFYAGIPDTFFINKKNTDWRIKITQFSERKTGDWKYYHPNGKIYMETHFVDSDTIERMITVKDTSGKFLIKNGEGTLNEFYASGKPKLISNYKEGLLDGVFKEWNPNGMKKTEGAYKNGLKDETWSLYYFVTDQIYQKQGYKNGQKDGVFKEYLPNDTLVIDGNYKSGKKDGHWIFYFETGAKDMEGDFKNDLQENHWKFWYPNGQLYYEGDFIGGNKTGKWQFFYNTGELWKEGEYQNNLREGLWTNYYENGQEAFQGAFEHDKESGVWTSWYENGEVKDKGSYTNGNMDGAWEGFYPNGKKRYEGDYKNDLKTGKWSYWDSEGKLKDVGYFAILKVERGIIVSSTNNEQSFRHGHWKSYSTIDGKIVSEGDYSYGKQNGKWKYYYPGGEVVANEVNYKEGLLNGKSSSFSRRGNLQTEINYKNNKKHGDMKVYSKKGKLVMHVVYKNGVKVKTLVQDGNAEKILYKYTKPPKEEKVKPAKKNKSSILH